MKKTGVIINPNAKKFRTGRASIKKYMNYNSDNVMVSAPQNITELKKTAEIFKDKKIDYICIGGGDGTIHIVLSELINSYKPEKIPPVLILKEGTMDNIARSLNLRGRGPGLLKKLLQRIESGLEIKTERRYTINVADKYCFLFGIGMVTNFLRKAYSGKEKGFFRNFQVMMLSIKEAILNEKNGEIFNFTEQAIYVDNKRIFINPVLGILAGTVEHIGMGFSPLKEAVKKDMNFQVLIFGIDPRIFLLNINKIRSGKRIKSPKYLNVSGNSIIIKNKGEFNYTMDGDLYAAENELSVLIGPSIELIKF